MPETDDHSSAPPELHERVAAEAARMSFGDHLEELRTCIIRALLGIAIAAGVALFFGTHVLQVLFYPLWRAQAVNGLQPTIQSLAPTDTFSAYLKMSLMAGLIVSMPWVMLQVWKFVYLGLYPHERRFVKRLTLASAGLFAVGVLFLYFFVLPVVLQFFISFNKAFEPVVWLPASEVSDAEGGHGPPYTGSPDVAPDTETRGDATNTGASRDAETPGDATNTGASRDAEIANSPPPLAKGGPGGVDPATDDDRAADDVYPSRDRKGANSQVDPSRGREVWDSPGRGAMESGAQPQGDIFRVPLLAKDPPDPQPGQLWVNTRTHRLTLWWQDSLWSAGLTPGAIAPAVESQFAVPAYISFVLMLALAFGIAFETPIVVLFLVWSNLVPVETFSRYRRHVVLGIVFASAILTPTTDLLSQSLLAVPMYLLFEAGLAAAKVMERRRSGAVA